MKNFFLLSVYCEAQSLGHVWCPLARCCSWWWTKTWHLHATVKNAPYNFVCSEIDVASGQRHWLHFKLKKKKKGSLKVEQCQSRSWKKIRIMYNMFWKLVKWRNPSVRALSSGLHCVHREDYKLDFTLEKSAWRLFLMKDMESLIVVPGWRPLWHVTPLCLHLSPVCFYTVKCQNIFKKYSTAL